MKNRTFEEHVENAMDYFDFEKVREHMVRTDWKWYSSKTEDQIPDIAELRQGVRRLMKSAYEQLGENGGQVACGGFYITYKEFEDGDRFDILFSIASWSTETDD